MDERATIRRRVMHRGTNAGVDTRNLEDWANEDAYVLLGEPGAGKTIAMRAEATRVGGWFVTARDFLALAPRSSEIVFIDGIDEVRATSPNHDGPLDAIRSKLQAMGYPRFRLSCREADWIAADRSHLAAVSPSGKVSVLQLAPLNTGERQEILGDTASLLSGLSKDLEPLLGNPLLVGLIVDVVGAGEMPRSRTQLYEMACKSLATEHNPAVRIARRTTGSELDAQLHDAGLLCALLLTADRVGYNNSAPGITGNTVTLEDIPPALNVKDAPVALASRLFVDLGSARVPRHRTIAEYLAARSISQLISAKGLPMSRVLALTCGFDGKPTEPLRGLHAWLSVHCAKDRSILIARDPLGVVLYGDVRNFDVTSKIQVFRGLQEEAERFFWFRNGDWSQHPFGALGTADMSTFLAGLMNRPERDPVHQVLLECALDAIEFGDPLPELVDDLLRIIRDETYWERIRLGALDAWMKQASDVTTTGLQLLEDVNQQTIDDKNDEIAGRLLSKLYPSSLSARQALKYFHPRKNKNLIGAFQMFWGSEFVDRIKSCDLAEIADDALPRLAQFWNDEDVSYELRSLSGQLVARAVTEAGGMASPAQLYAWLGAGMDRFGSARLEESATSAITNWLSEHPDAQKAVVAYGIQHLKKDSDGHVRTWRMTERLYRASRPSDWYSHLLGQASSVTDEEVARELFEDAASAVRHQLEGFDITLDALEGWVERHSDRWPLAPEWLSDALSSKTDAYQGQRHRESIANQAKEAERDEARRVQFAPFIEAICTGTAPAGVLHQIALAYDKRFYDIRGETPEERVANLLGVTIELARKCVQGLRFSIDRDDLPQIDQIFALDLESRYHLLRPACLLGLRLRLQLGEDLAITLASQRFEQLFAFALTDGLDGSKSWAVDVMALHPEKAAPVFLQYATSKIVKHSDRSITGIWELRSDEAEDDRLAVFARMVLPGLLYAVPLRATEQHLNLLNRNLLPAATRYLPQQEVEAILDRRIGRASMSSTQKISWMAAGLAINPSKYLADVVREVGTNQKRAAALGTAVTDQSTKSKNVAKLAVEPLAKLVELLGPQTTPDWGKSGVVRDIDTRSDLVRGLVSQLASSTDPEAGAALKRLGNLPLLPHWKVHFDGALHDHTRVVRAATFVHPSPEQVGNTLGNLKPANAQDLMALTIDTLVDFQNHVRHGETNMLTQFWRPKDDGMLVPRSENECRDVLHQMLRHEFLKRNAQIEKEAHAADDRRADLRVSAIIDDRRFVLPVEIKKDNNREVYSAWRDQLAAQYASDPYADHTGLYLVLWFKHGTRSSAKGRHPATAAEMLNALKSSVVDDTAGRIHFFVLDLSRPN